MKNLQKAFTLIELVFVIVIIGILMMIAIPSLSTTRDDAKVANCVERITIFMRDVSTYYTSQGYYSLNMKDMSDIEVYEITPITANGDKGEYYFVCDKKKSLMTASDASITFNFSKIDDGTGNLRTNLNAVMVSVIQGTVDGDLGYLLKVKNIASDGEGINHAITGLRIKR
jgi:prepilin-type N-terminal cleavage/methylation domain-containing protein